MATDVEGYREYVTGRLPALRRVAYLRCGDCRTGTVKSQAARAGPAAALIDAAGLL